MMRFLRFSKIMLFFLLCACSTKTNNDTKDSLFGQENAVWTESVYLRGYRPRNGKKLKDEDLKRYVKTLKKKGVKYAYLFAGPYQNDGYLPDYPFSDIAKNSIKKLKEYYPELVILPWIGGIQNKTVYLDDSIWVSNALNDTKRLVEILNTPGVHIDFEYILRDSSYLSSTIGPEKSFDKKMYGNNVNSFHEKLRKILPDSFISSVVVATSPDTRPWKRKTTMEELSILVKYVDQLSFLYYDTYINSQDIFKKNCIKQVQDIETLKLLNTNTQFLLAIGTFINEPELRKFRNLEIENIPNSLNVIKESALEVSTSKKLVDGIAIYCDWETDKREWKDFYTNWVKD